MGIIVRDLWKSFGNPKVDVLKSVSLEITDGDFVSVTGRSGSGKSTLLYLISTLDTASSGEITIDGQNILKLTSDEVHEFRNTRMGFVFQFHYLLPELSAIENVLIPAMKKKRIGELDSYGRELLREFGLADKADRFPGQLSGGEQQRVAIARALVMRPKYLFADEPTGNLDSENGNAVMELFSKINKKFGTSIVFVTHDIDYAAIARRRVHLVDGKMAGGES